MTPCTCSAPGYCGHHGRHVSALGAKVWAGGDARSIEAYFRDGDAVPKAVPAAARAGACAYQGGPVTGPDGRQLLRDCPTCKGTVRLKVVQCLHPGHAADPMTTEKACRTCRDWAAERAEVEVVQVGGDPILNYWRGGS